MCKHGGNEGENLLAEALLEGTDNTGTLTLTVEDTVKPVSKKQSPKPRKGVIKMAASSTTNVAQKDSLDLENELPNTDKGDTPLPVNVTPADVRNIISEEVSVIKEFITTRMFSFLDIDMSSWRAEARTLPVNAGKPVKELMVQRFNTAKEKLGLFSKTLMESVDNPNFTGLSYTEADKFVFEVEKELDQSLGYILTMLIEVDRVNQVAQLKTTTHDEESSGAPGMAVSLLLLGAGLLGTAIGSPLVALLCVPLVSIGCGLVVYNLLTGW